MRALIRSACPENARRRGKTGRLVGGVFLKLTANTFDSSKEFA